MKRKRRKRVAQAKKLSKFIIIVYLIIVVIALIRYTITNNHYGMNFIFEITGYSILLCMAGVMIYYTVYELVIGPKKSKAEILEQITHKLSKTELVEIDFQIKNENSAIEMLKDILIAEGCKFYARLGDEEGEIIIQCIDKHGDIVYKDTIRNMWYF